MDDTPLRQTSIFQASPLSATPASGNAFNPYTLHKVILKIEGDPRDMAKDWKPEEYNAKRRLVQFERSRSGDTITTSFEAVSPKECTPNSIYTSCILWRESYRYVVTSFDIIHLVESLIAVRFTVEERNRIARILESFKPLTISKTKDDSKSFFNVVMDFPNPKPRSIGKDIKVFP